MPIYSILDWFKSNFSLEKINLILDFIKFSHSNFDVRSLAGDFNIDFIKISHSNLDGRSVESDLNADFIKN